MRVFFAIEFDDVIKNYLSEVQHEVRSHCISGNFSFKENFHLTLRFLGEQNTQQVENLKQVLKDVAGVSEFELRLDKLGSFRKGNRSIIWVGLEKSLQLQQLYNNMEKTLSQNGYQKEERSYNPHITLAREVKMEKFEFLAEKTEIEQLTVKVKSISLMESKRINDKLAYVPLERVELQHDL
ncbi:RNA 2',3'-cyclic phosphodiesterase [Ruminiclostridium papyrosolvens]|uniref:RNA 2',3'-cyclic phosphodiesterase n=1 Tax=Ruminiclostridium papyrosolvens C7 TaxID=1330534 RepID=U4R3Q8_9FIRM|nr:RNA 2',3'-cyclic phosphodiesterase [Ruminiclostridium papyrosolvens]EPR13186.1 2'-5' RNA ligase [Ruminiclostridium papyrosolvens C7]